MDRTWLPVVQWLFDVERDLPAEVDEKLRLLVLDTLACAVAGQSHPEVTALMSASELTSPGATRLIGARSPAIGLTPGAAAGVFTAAACWDEFCEGHDRARGRPGLHSVGLPLALAAQQHLSVRAVLFAVLAGYEVGARFGAALFTRQGLHVDGTWGTAAAAAAGAVALGLPVEGVTEAVGIASATPLAPLYLSVPEGALARNIYAARGVLGGLDSAAAAAAGITGPDGAVAATVHLLGRSGSEPDLVAPGEFMLLGGYLKPWPGVRHAHYAIKAALDLHHRLAATGTTVGADDPIRLMMHPAAVEYAGVRAPQTRLAAQFSCTYAAAHALRHGTFDLDAFTAEAIHDPAVAALEQRIELVAGHAGGRYAELLVRSHRAYAQWAPGDPGHALDQEAVRTKAVALMTPTLRADLAAELAHWVLAADPDAPWRPPDQPNEGM